MKKFFVTIFLSLLVFSAFSKHIKGGFLSYQYLGTGLTNPNNLRYKITLTVYMSCDPNLTTGGPNTQVSNPINITIFRGDGTTQVANPSANISRDYLLDKLIDEPCITGNQAECYYRIVVYELNNYELPVSTDGYTIRYQRCCRINDMDNIFNSQDVGNTYSINIPGTSSPVPNANHNSSPSYPVSDTAVVCGGSYFSFPLGALDPDDDELVYSLCSAYTGGSSGNPNPSPAAPGTPALVDYSDPYSGSQPMGEAVTIDPVTGILSGIAPPIVNTGEYVVTVCVQEYRNGVFLAESRKELHIKVKDCIPLRASLDPKPVTCDGFTISFSNGFTLPSGTNYQWDFGDTASGALNTSASPTPTHTYTDSGSYTLKLKVSQAGGLCADSTTLVVKVYPGFFPAFNANPPFCKGIPISFTDQTTTNYGVPTGWRWDFGNTTATNDTSNVKNPFYTYSTDGAYTVSLIVSNTFGCTDTITRDIIVVDKPPLIVTGDTTYCALDSVPLSATIVGTGGIFSWTPATNIIGANTATPRVFPPVPTTYYIRLNQNGCIATDSVRVNPANNLTTAISASATNICEDDTVTLTGSSNYTNGLSWQWSPTAKLLTPAAKVTKAFPSATTLYTLTTHWGRNCVATATQNITVKPLAVADAGLPAAFCKGQGSAQLQASGGINYQWIPSTGLNDPNIANPVATPSVTTVYKVLVGVAGCSAKKADSVRILVRALPPLTLTNDTLICSIDTLKLKATGTGTFAWLPNYMISSLSSPTPLVSPDVPTKYFVTLTDGFGCVSNDSVLVDVKLFVTINAGNDTTICRTDGFLINTTSDALSYKWTPSTYLNSDTAKRPFATPLVPQITYRVVGNIGKCQSNSTVKVSTVPYPVPYAGKDTTICFGSSAPLQASGGSSYTWMPATFLSATNIANPVSVKPTDTLTYVVTVTDTLGCPKPVMDSVNINVYPKILASTGIRDTSIVVGQLLQLNAGGGRPGDRYLWTPSTWLSNPNIARPVASPEADIEYKLFITTVPEGCTGMDSVKIKVFKLPPSFYVPTAFSPNGDGKNDFLFPKALGMKSLRYFKVYNRLGQMVFSTTVLNAGWDGTFKGNPQDPATYVWMAQGETYTGEFITRKGYAVLIR